MDNGGDILRLCRLCLVKDDVNIPIFEEQGDIRQIFLKISSCLPVKVSREDKLPKKICDGCSYKLDMLYEFWNTTANAEKQLLSWLGEAGMNAKMADGTISAVAQQIKPVETFVKQEAIDPSDIHTEDDDKSYMFQQKFAVEEAGPSATVTSNEEEPPPKRARRTAAVKAQIAMDPESDDDDDSGEPMTKVEDESEESDGDDHEPPFVDVPSTSADDQPGPSGVGKDGVEAPSHHTNSEEETTDENHAAVKEVHQVVVLLTDIQLNNDLENKLTTDPPTEERRKKYTCYVCMAKFFTTADLDKHKSVHNDENDADITKDDDKDSDYSGNEESEESESDHDDLIKETPIPPATNTNLITFNAFNCLTCKIKLKTLNDLRTHTSGKCTFSCNLCSRNFNNSDIFLCHVVHHRINFLSLRFFKCEKCSLFFDNYFRLRKHESVSHNLKPWADRDKLPPLSDRGADPGETSNLQVIKEEPPDQDLSEARGETTTIACELCFDLCNSDEEFFAHMEFHRQLAIRDSDDLEITNNKVDTCTANSNVTSRVLSKRPVPPEKFTPKPAQIVAQAKTKLVRILPKVEKKPAPNKISSFTDKLHDSTSTVNTEKTSVVYQKNSLKVVGDTFPYKIQVSSSIDVIDKDIKPTGTPTATSKPPNVTIKQLDMSAVSPKRLVVKKELSGPSGKWVLTQKDSVAVKDFFNRKIKESTVEKYKNIGKCSSVTTNTTHVVTTTTSKAVVVNPGVTTKQSVSTKPVMSPQSTATSINTPMTYIPRSNTLVSKSNPPKVMIPSKPIPIRPNTMKGTQPAKPVKTKMPPAPSLVPIPPAANPYINVALDKQAATTEASNWSNTQNTSGASSNLIYVINPVNNLGVPPKSQMTYINDTSNITYLLMPQNPTENVSNVNFAPQTSVFQNTFPVQDANKVVYTLPSIDQSLSLVSQSSSPQLSNPVTMPVLSSDNNLIFISNQPSNSVQGNMQATGMINTIVTQNNLQPGGAYFQS